MTRERRREVPPGLLSHLRFRSQEETRSKRAIGMGWSTAVRSRVLTIGGHSFSVLPGVASQQPLGGCRKTSRPIFEFSVLGEHAVPALDWQGCMQVREAATTSVDGRVPQRLSYMVAADVPTRTGDADGGDDRGGFIEGAQKTPHTVSKRTRRSSSWNLTDRLELVLRIYDRLPEGDKWPPAE